MNYLLDTHAFLWWITGESRLPFGVQKALAQGTGVILISVGSLWEIALKVKLGKLKMPDPLDSYLLQQIQINRMEVLPIHSPHVFETMHLPPHHRDPFDRLLIAQARTEALTLVSGDRALSAYDVPILW